MGRITQNVQSPPHPGETLRDDVLPALGLTATDAVAQLGVSRAVLSRVLNGRTAIFPTMALRIEVWLGIENGGSVDAWLAQKPHTTFGKHAKLGRRPLSRQSFNALSDRASRPRAREPKNGISLPAGATGKI
jgi:addiction module HigA family antidote